MVRTTMQTHVHNAAPSLRSYRVVLWLIALVAGAAGCGAQQGEVTSENSVVTRLPNVSRVAVGPGERVYAASWSLIGQGAIWSIGSDGRAASIAAEGATSLAFSATDLYFAQPRTGSFAPGGIGGVSLVGGSRQRWAAGVNVTDVAVDGEDLYWLAPNEGVFRASTRGGAPTKVIATADSSSGLAIDDAYAYWVTQHGMSRAPRNGGPTEVIVDRSVVEAQGTLGPRVFAIGKSHIYAVSGAGWASPTPSGAVYRMRKDGTELTVLARDQYEPAAIAVDDEHVYWSRGEGNQFDPNGGHCDLVRMPLAGGAIQVLADGQNGILSIALSNANAYWINRFRGDIWMRHK